MKNALKVLSVLIVAGLICVLSYFIVNRPMPIPGPDQLWELEVKDMNSLKILFGEQYVYPDSNTATKIQVHSKPGDTLIEYVGKTEYIPFLHNVFWEDRSDGFNLMAGMIKSPDYNVEKQFPNIEPERIGAFDCYMKRVESLQDSDFAAVTLAFQQKDVTYLLQIDYPDDLTPDSGDYEARVSAMEEALKNYVLKFV